MTPEVVKILSYKWDNLCSMLTGVYPQKQILKCIKKFIGSIITFFILEYNEQYHCR